MTDASPRTLRLRRALRFALDLPSPLRAALAGAPRTNDRGDVLDPELQLMVRLDGLQAREMSEDVGRARRDLVRSVQIVEAAPRRVARTEDRVADGVPIRVYVPAVDGGPWPVVVYLHGGGWAVGDLRSHDRQLRRLCVDAGCVVVAVDYPLAPEHPFPGGLEACVATYRWVRAHAAELEGDPGRVAIGGDSAGGNLAAAACLRLRDLGQPQPTFQLLLYPATDLRCVSASYHALGQGYLLTHASIAWYLRHLGADPLDPRASVLLEPDLAGLAPALITTAGFDPLRDDGEQYAARLREAGVEVDELRFPSMVHGFYAMDGAIAGADAAIERTLDRVRERWGDGRGIGGFGSR